jgi:hypothetical protein
VKFQRLTTGMTCLPAGRLIANHLNESNSSTKQHRESKENQLDNFESHQIKPQHFK